MTPHLRPCREDEFHAILAIINAAAEAYRGVIPDDCWHEPYMSAQTLRREIDAGVRFLGCEIAGDLTGVMGAQTVRNVDLIRHAYVRPGFQGHGVGSRLIEAVCAAAERPLLVGAWAAAHWAIAFYERHGFQLTPPGAKTALLQAYWTVSERQIETSVVLAQPGLSEQQASALIAAG